MLSKKDKEKYIKEDYNECPYCKSDDIEAGVFEADSNYAWREITCLDCKKVWKDIYELVDVENVQ